MSTQRTPDPEARLGCADALARPCARHPPGDLGGERCCLSRMLAPVGLRGVHKGQTRAAIRQPPT